MIRRRSVNMIRGLGLFVGLLVLLGGASPRTLAAFDSGSTGANGTFPPAALPQATTAITLDLRDGVVSFLPGGTTVALPNVPAGGFADGILHFTTVDIPTGVTLTFIRHAANTPVTILAQGDVTVAGTIDVSGENGGGSGNGRGGTGGPGGFKGGNGEILRSSPGAGGGLGPGGGKGGERTGTGTNPHDGGGGGGFGFAGSSSSGAPSPAGGGIYGTSALLPLVGGSGGGGGSSGTDTGPSGGGGGGGGGAILIASSATITISGAILAKGGAGGTVGGGGGSGGAIRLIADTLAGSGTLSAAGGAGGSSGSIGVQVSSAGGAGGGGRIRLDSLIYTFTGTTTGVVSGGGPSIVFLPNAPTVRIVSVDGKVVPDNPTGGIGGIDVVIDGPGTVPIVLEASRVRLGTTIAVTAKPESDASVIGPVISPGLAGTFESSAATVNLTFPSAGVFFLEARATFTLP